MKDKSRFNLTKNQEKKEKEMDDELKIADDENKTIAPTNDDGIAKPLKGGLGKSRSSTQSSDMFRVEEKNKGKQKTNVKSTTHPRKK